MTPSRLITGLILVFIGFWIIFANFTVWILWIYGLALIILGIFILLNRGEDQIEKIKSRRKK